MHVCMYSTYIYIYALGHRDVNLCSYAWMIRVDGICIGKESVKTFGAFVFFFFFISVLSRLKEEGEKTQYLDACLFLVIFHSNLLSSFVIEMHAIFFFSFEFDAAHLVVYCEEFF